jgi:hypothetical protein
VSAGARQHFREDALGQDEEAREVDPDNGVVVVPGVIKERLTEVDAGIIDERVDAPELPERLADNAVGGCGVAASPSTESTAGSSAGLMVRALAITAQSRSR